MMERKYKRHIGISEKSNMCIIVLLEPVQKKLIVGLSHTHHGKMTPGLDTVSH